MNRSTAAMLAILLLTCGGAAQAATATGTRLLALEQTWLEAAENRDLATLNRILSDSYVDINYRGVLRTKADALRAPNVTLKHPTQTLSEEKVRIYGNVAIVTGLGTLGANGRTYHWRFTDVFVLHGRTWRAVSSQETAVR